MPKDDVAQILDQLLAKSLIQSACIDVLLQLHEVVLEKLGASVVNGLPVREYFQKAKYEHLETILIGLEDKDAGVAAFLQNAIDDYRRRIGENP